MNDGDGRLLEVRGGPLQDRVWLTGFSGTEAMSRPFGFELDLASEDGGLSFEEIVGHPIAFGLRFPDRSKERIFHGIVRRFSVLSPEKRLFRYKAEVVPWLWLLTRTTDCRIHQGASVPEILQETFSRLGFTDFQLKLTGDYPKREYCVQYRESAFHFLSRLMEQEGIFYFFQHANEKHTLIVGDSPSVCTPCQVQSRVPYSPAYRTALLEEEDCVAEFRPQVRVHPGKFAIKDYDFESPSTALLAEASSAEKRRTPKELEIFDYPGGFRRRAEGSRLADLRVQAEDAAMAAIAGSGCCRAFESGRTFELSDHPDRALNAQYVLTSVRHSARSPEVYSNKKESESYRNSFTVIPKAVPYRPPAAARRPVVQGCQTGMVTGPEGEEIYTDKYGRVKVHFHWDRHSPYNAGSSCWMRVTQAWAGRNFGSIWIPRIGQEVIVDFLDGDPDRPVITGAVYNAEQAHPADLPANKMRSGFHSQSTETGSPSNFNQLRFDDTPGKEEIYVHAQKDWNHKINNNRVTNVGRNDMTMIVGSQTLKISGSDKQQIGQLETDVVFGDQKTEIKGASTINIGAAEMEIIHGAVEHKTDGPEQHMTGAVISMSSRDQHSWRSKGAASLLAAIVKGQSKGATVVVANGVIVLSAPLIRLKGNVICDNLFGKSTITVRYNSSVCNLV